MMIKKFTIKEAFSSGFEKWKSQWGLLSLLFFFTLIIGGLIPYILNQVLYKGFGNVIAQIIGYLLAAYANLGLINATFLVAKNREVKMSDYFDTSFCYFRYLFAQILFQIMVTIGLILLIIPGIYLFVKFYLYPYYVIEKGLSPMDAFRAAGQDIYGSKWDMLLFAILAFLLNFLGLICFFIGMFVTVPIVLIATASIYLKLQSQTLTEITQS